MSDQTDRYKLDQFYQGKGSEPAYFTTSLINEEIFEVENLRITGLSRDIPGSTPKTLKQAEQNWIDNLPKLYNVRTLSLLHTPKQEYFEAICKMKNLKRLDITGSPIEDITAISQLKTLRRLDMDSFTRLKDLSPILGLKHLTHLSIENSFKIENYEIIGNLHTLIGLQLAGDFASPKNLRLNSLIPYKTLKELKHLDLAFASVIDNSYETILSLPNLERFDTTARMPGGMREKIKAEHKTLKAGFFMDYDFDNKRFYEGKAW
jgi:hypothetical protein